MRMIALLPDREVDLGRVEDWISFFLRVTASTMALGLVAWAGHEYILPQFASNRLLQGIFLCIHIALAAAAAVFCRSLQV